MNESGVTRKVNEALASMGALVWKISDRFHASRPDSLFVKGGITGYFEMKVYPNKPTALQERTLLDLAMHQAPAWLITYYPATKTFRSITIATGEITPHTDHRSLASWLLERLCLNTSASSLS